MNLTSPISVPTWESSFYALIIVKVSCYYLVGWVLKRKEDVGTAVYDVIAILEQ